MNKKYKLPYYLVVMRYQPKKVVAPHPFREELINYRRITDKYDGLTAYVSEEDHLVTLDRLIRMIVIKGDLLEKKKGK